MKDEIVAKLNRHLASGFQKEADVVYAMAEVRKLFEHVRTMSTYPVLAFYTNWSLHTKIDREPWAAAGLKMVEDAVVGFRSASDPRQVEAVNGVLSFQRLHHELLQFGDQYGIRFDRLSNVEWRSFAILLIDVVIDCPLEAGSAMSAVRKLSLSRDFTFTYAGGQTMAFWRIDLKDGTLLTGPIF